MKYHEAATWSSTPSDSHRAGRRPSTTRNINKEHLFEPNALNRFSLGTEIKSLKYNADGSLTLYFQHQPPGTDKESNWAPAPKDEFSPYIRAYWPKAEILKERWTPPPVQRIQ